MNSEIDFETLKWLLGVPACDFNFKSNLAQANEATIRTALARIKEGTDVTRKKALERALKKLTEPPPQISYASQLLACRLCHHSRPECAYCCKSCTDTCNGKQGCYQLLPEKELVNRSHILIPPKEEPMRKSLPKVPVSEAEKSDPALHMEMETLRAEREERHAAEEAQAERETRIAEAHEVAGRIQAFSMMNKLATVTTLIQLKKIKESKAYRDLPNIGTWEKYCQYLGLDRHTIDQNLLNLAAFGEEFLVTATNLNVSHRDLRQLRQLKYDGESFQMSDDGKTVIIEGEAISLGDDAAPEIEAALEKLLEKNKTLRERNTKLEKEFKAAVKEEVHGLETEKKSLVERVKALEVYEPDEKDREWSVKQMEAIEEAAGTFQLSITRFIIDPRVKDDRHLQAKISGHLQEAELALQDVRSRLDAVIDMFND